MGQKQEEGGLGRLGTETWGRGVWGRRGEGGAVGSRLAGWREKEAGWGRWVSPGPLAWPFNSDGFPPPVGPGTARKNYPDPSHHLSFQRPCPVAPGLPGLPPFLGCLPPSSHTCRCPPGMPPEQRGLGQIIIPLAAIHTVSGLTEIPKALVILLPKKHLLSGHRVPGSIQSLGAPT